MIRCSGLCGKTKPPSNWEFIKKVEQFVKWIKYSCMQVSISPKSWIG